MDGAFKLRPAVALYNMRDYAQDSVARYQLELFAKYYGAGHAFFAWGGFFAALAFLVGLCRTLGCAASGAGLMLFFESICAHLISPLTAMRPSHLSLAFARQASQLCGD